MPRNASRAYGGGRLYTWDKSGERFWSVTTIIGGAIPKNGLMYWAAGKVAEFAHDEASTWLGMTRARAIDWLKREPMRYTGDKADTGSAVHAALEAIVIGKALPRFKDPVERAVVGSFLDWTRKAKPTFELAEASVYNRRQRYAGTLDFIASFDFADLAALALELGVALPEDWQRAADLRGGRIRLLGDYKTGGDVEAGKGIYPEVGLQLNAYAFAEFVGLANGVEAPIPEVDGALALHLGAAGWRMVPVRVGEDIFKAFLYAREVFRWVEQTSKTVLGDPLERLIPVDEEVDA